MLIDYLREPLGRMQHRLNAVADPPSFSAAASVVFSSATSPLHLLPYVDAPFRVMDLVADSIDSARSNSGAVEVEDAMNKANLFTNRDHVATGSYPTWTLENTGDGVKFAANNSHDNMTRAHCDEVKQRRRGVREGL